MAFTGPNSSHIYHSVKVKVTFTVGAVPMTYYPIALVRPPMRTLDLCTILPQGTRGEGHQGLRGGTFDRGRTG